MDRRLMAAGISPDEFDNAAPPEREQLLHRAARAESIQQGLLRAVPSDGEVGLLRYRDLRTVRRTVHDQDWRRARTEARRAMNREAWRHRARQNLFRAGR
jgi:hypothetical protein